MEDSLTGQAPVEAASVTEPTVQSTEVQTPAEAVNQEATTVETPVTTEEASTQAATTQTTEEKQTQTGGLQDDGLAKFAKSQGFDPDNLTEGEAKALKLAHENQKAFRKSTVAQTKAALDGDITRDELVEFQSEFRSYQAQKQAEQFFSQEGRDDSLAPVMTKILEEKRAEHGDEYARVLSQDLNLLYDLAQLNSGAGQVDTEAIRRQERESINQKLAAGTSAAHATSSADAASGAPKIDAEWIKSTYDPRNPEHIQLMTQAGLR